jgi:tripartite-type tricarboxylate transporter receptor subunit TctC
VEAFYSWSSNGSNLFDVPTIADEEMGGFEPFDWLTETGRALWTNPNATEEAMDWWESTIEDVMTSDMMQEWSEETGQHIQFAGREEANEAFENSIEGIQEDLDIDAL